MSIQQWEEDFAWLRRLAPSAREIEVYDDRIEGKRHVKLRDATDEDVRRVHAAVVFRAPLVQWAVSP